MFFSEIPYSFLTSNQSLYNFVIAAMPMRFGQTCSNWLYIHPEKNPIFVY